jgi:hypothetical protein
MPKTFYLAVLAPNTMIEDTKKTPQKPKWLRVSEQQSQQSELIISGVTIFGVQPFPALIFNTPEDMIIRFSDDNLQYLELLFNYPLTGIRLLIAEFILHFALRALWIGMLGLVSVCPQRIGDFSHNYTPHYLQKLKKNSQTSILLAKD